MRITRFPLPALVLCGVAMAVIGLAVRAAARTRWRSMYGSVVSSVHEGATADDTDEKGLVSYDQSTSSPGAAWKSGHNRSRFCDPSDHVLRRLP